MESSKCPPGTERLVTTPSSSSSSSHGVGFGPCFPQTSGCTSHQGPWPQYFCASATLWEAWAMDPAGTSVSISSSLSSSTMMSESCCARLPSIMETSLMFPSSSAGGGMSSLGLLSLMEPSHFCPSSSQTWSSHDMEEEWLTSMASLKAV